jgi:hypothetical protein
MHKQEKNNSDFFDFQWTFTPESDSTEEDNKYKDFLKRMYLQNLQPSLVLKIDRDCSKRNYK